MGKIATSIGKAEAITTTGKDYTLAAPSRKTGQYLGMSIDRTGWTDPTQRLTVSLMVSLNGGASWLVWCSYEDRGGEFLGPDGKPILTSSFVAAAPPVGALMKLRASATGKTVQQGLSFVEVS